tara:strand:- start:665 stop:1909 length:1245 start_codon:yes stop_codon:yes gene_type:complete
MDKKETTRLLNNLIEYNRVDINNMKGTFPELGDAFMNVILAIDEEYGSGNIDRTLLRTPVAQSIATDDVEEFGKQFVGRFLYKAGGKEWYYFDSLISQKKIDEINQDFVYKIYTNTAFSDSNVPQEILWTKANLKENFKDTGAGGWLPFNLKPGDKVAIPETKMGVKIATSTIPVVINRTLKQNQDYLYIKDLYDIRNGQYYLVLTNNLNEVGGDHFIMQDVTPYQQASAVQTKKVDFKEGDRFYVLYSPKEIYTIKKINQNDIIIGYTNVAGKYSENARIIKDAQENFDNGVWILSGKSTTLVKYITQWTPDWKTRGLRPSPTRKASLEKVDALGLGNDGIIYKVEEDKRGVKKWKKTGFTRFNGNNRDDFSSKYDLELLYDQLVYENTELDSTDIEFKDNEKLITIIINKLQ